MGLRRALYAAVNATKSDFCDKYEHSERKEGAKAPCAPFG
jgi:hypothetical protein